MEQKKARQWTYHFNSGPVWSLVAPDGLCFETQEAVDYLNRLEADRAALREALELLVVELEEGYTPAPQQIAEHRALLARLGSDDGVKA